MALSHTIFLRFPQYLHLLKGKRNDMYLKVMFKCKIKGQIELRQLNKNADTILFRQEFIEKI